MFVHTASAVARGPFQRAPAYSRALAVALLLLAGLVIGQVALLSWYPVGEGSFSARLGSASDGCDGGALANCTFVPFQPGHEIGVVFSVHNGGPIPISIESVDAFGADLPGALMTLEPRLPADPNVIGIEGSQPFAPISVDRKSVV